MALKLQSCQLKDAQAARQLSGTMTSGNRRSQARACLLKGCIPQAPARRITQRSTTQAWPADHRDTSQRTHLDAVAEQQHLVPPLAVPVVQQSTQSLQVAQPQMHASRRA